MDTSLLQTQWRGREAYSATWGLQLELHKARRAGSIPDQLILVEHDPVITLGRSGDPANLLLDRAALSEAGIDYFEVERGGDITYHGPGQLVAYPVISLRERSLSLRDYMRGLEEALIALCADYGVEGARVPGRSGVWHSAGKLAAVGVAVAGGVSYHGIALNLTTDLSHFAHIVPCGISDASVASLESVSGQIISLDSARASFERCFRSQFGYAADNSLMLTPQ
jgi:lipoyl(octanoyl) transferase